MHTVADFDAVFTHLDPAIGAAAFDLPGFGGGMSEPASPMGSDGYAEIVAPAMAEVATEGPLVLVGHSFGGRVALQLAAAHPDRVGGLVLTGVPNLLLGTGPRPAPPLAYRMARWLHRRGLISDDRMEQRRHQSGSADYRNATPVMRGVLVRATAEHYEEQLAGLQCPVEMVWGERDTAAPVDVAQQAATGVLGGRANLDVLTGVGHLTPVEAPEAVAAAITRCLNRVGS